MEAKQLWGVTYEENICEKMMCVKNIMARVYRNASLHVTLVGIHETTFIIGCSGSNLPARTKNELNIDKV
jgi:hypothetical protein